MWAAKSKPNRCSIKIRKPLPEPGSRRFSNVAQSRFVASRTVTSGMRWLDVRRFERQLGEAAARPYMVWLPTVRGLSRSIWPEAVVDRPAAEPATSICLAVALPACKPHALSGAGFPLVSGHPHPPHARGDAGRPPPPPRHLVEPLRRSLAKHAHDFLLAIAQLPLLGCGLLGCGLLGCGLLGCGPFGCGALCCGALGK